MTDRPIIFSAPMVMALLDGRKTETRRLAWRPWQCLSCGERNLPWDKVTFQETHDERYGGCGGAAISKPTIWQKASAGDRLWVRETWQDFCPTWGGHWCGCGSQEMRERIHQPAYRATLDERGEPKRWRPSIHMPRWASRLTLVVTEARRERLQEISEEAAMAEGVPMHVVEQTFRKCYRDDAERAAKRIEYFANIWNSLHGPGAWEANPEVMAIRFEVHRANIDSKERAA